MAQTNKHTNKQTDGHRNSMTESTQCGRFSENTKALAVVCAGTILKQWTSKFGKLVVLSLIAYFNYLRTNILQN